ncbi:unnamed protein product [Brachionus calyciflorus]|uniref:Uncharacterized protein n=1 Tax=Brachionus calyciflorus TaxID=104777 RepID=A0A813NZU5_9BILA|nr:unnamed protein product [Brachionus calyciflorus]
MASRKRPESVTRINARVENFLAQKLGAENVEFYEQESCIEDNKKKFFFGKFGFRSLIICDDRIYIADNPPKNLDNYVFFDDIIDIKTIDDIPKFLSGVEKENAVHIRIKFYNNPKRKKDFEKLKNKLIELKKDIVFSKSVDNKLLEIELNTPRAILSSRSGRDVEKELISMSTFREWTSYLSNNETLRLDLDFTNRSDLMLTNRTLKSVRFDDETKKNEKNEEEKNIDPLTDKAVKQRYQTLIEMVNKSRLNNTTLGNNSQDLNLFSLSLPLTPRSIDGKSLPEYTKLADDTNITYVSKNTSRSLQDISDKINKDFIKDCEKVEDTLDIYVLNPKSKIFQTLKVAHFNSKLRGTLNFHLTIEEMNKSYERKFEKKSKLDKRFKQLKTCIFNNVDNLVEMSNLYDDLLRITYDFTYMKKCFWNSSDFYIFTVKQLNRYIPITVTNMNLGKTSGLRRVKELELSIVLVETLIIMFQETEFFSNRNEILYEEKCKYLSNLIKSLICDPEIAELIEKSYDDEIYDLKTQMKAQLLDLTLVSCILLWEILHFISLNSWNGADFNLEILIKIIEKSEYLEIFLSRVIGELSKLLNTSDSVLLSPKETIVAYKILSFLYTLIEKSTTSKIKKILKDNYYEEFKYYFNEDRIRLKTFNYYPIIDDLLIIVKKLSRHIM